MKKKRFIPYGYTVKNGLTVIDTDEAKIIRGIFDAYLQGDSLKEIADTLTALKVPYTEKTTAWDKARIARIIENARYIGDDEYANIIDEDTYEQALRLKSSRQLKALQSESKNIAQIKKYVRCAECGKPMTRHTNNACRIRESWACSNPECGASIRLGDNQLQENLKILMNRIIQNEQLLSPTIKREKVISPRLGELNNEISRELERENPNEDYIIEKTIEIGHELYNSTTDRMAIITALAKKRVRMMSIQEEFNLDYFLDIAEYITIDTSGKVKLYTKTGTEVGY